MLNALVVNETDLSPERTCELLAAQRALETVYHQARAVVEDRGTSVWLLPLRIAVERATRLLGVPGGAPTRPDALERSFAADALVRHEAGLRILHQRQTSPIPDAPDGEALPPAAGCQCGVPWPCSTALLLARLDDVLLESRLAVNTWQHALYQLGNANRDAEARLDLLSPPVRRVTEVLARQSEAFRTAALTDAERAWLADLRAAVETLLRMVQSGVNPR